MKSGGVGSPAIDENGRSSNLKRKADGSVDSADSPPVKSNDAHDGATSSFAGELQRAGLSIFQPLVAHGYFAWDPSGALSPQNEPIYSPMSNITSADEILKYADVDGRPDRLLPLEGIRQQLPKPFLGREQFNGSAIAKSIDSRFPFGEIGVASLAIAAMRGVNLQQVDFSFGGSTLHFLASRGEKRGTTAGRYLACRVPGTNCIFVSNRTRQQKESPTNIGFQFERLVTGGDMANASSMRTVEHLHTMKVGNRTVLFRAEVDALDGEGMPVEVKVSPATWTTSVLLQMVSNGSSTLCKGTRTEAVAPKIRRRGYALGGGRGTAKQKVLTSVEMLSLSEVAALALERVEATTLERNIVEAMEAMQVQIQDEGVYELRFAENGRLRLESVEDADTHPFPPHEVVARLVG
ncbi:hypothetical protein ACHAXT_010508 [Thalassiosira profunda]